MPLRIYLIALLALLVAVDAAHAASGDEIRMHRALFTLKDFQQMVELQYLFQDSDNGTRSSSSNSFQENYRLNLATDVLDPHLLNLRFAASAGLNQSSSHSGQNSSSGNDLRYNYQLSASGLDKSVTPFNINSYMTTETVVRPFSPTYTTDTSGNELYVSLRNSLLPSQFSFARRTLDTSGGGNDSNTTSNAFSYSVSHRYKDFSGTGLSLSLSDSTGSFTGSPEQTSRSYFASLNNNLGWGKEKKYTLDSLAQISDQQSQGVPQRSISVSESFHDQLGKALNLQMTYAFAKSSILGFSSQDSGSSRNRGEIKLSHRLFESVTTTVSGTVSQSEILDGTEFTYSGNGLVLYTKKLPENNRLTISTNATHTVVDNKFKASLLTVLNESHTSVHQGDIVELPVTAGTLNSVIRVSSSVLTYSDLSDYTVDFTQGTISIVRGGRIDSDGTGTDLQISYTVAVEPDLKFASDAFGLAGNMTFSSGKYQLGGSYTQQSQSRVGGPSQNALRDSSNKMLYFNASLNPLTYRLSYADTITGSLESQKLEASGAYARDTRFGNISLSGAERFSWNGGSSTSPAFTENSLFATVQATRNVFSGGRMLLSANVLDERNSLRGARDIVTLRASVQCAIKKVALRLDGQSSWTIAQGVTTRNDTITTNITRAF